MAIWLTTPLESNDSGNLVMATVRKDVNSFRNNPKFKYRVEVTWTYDAADKGMPSEETSILMDEVLEKLEAEFRKDPVAVMTEIYTGEGARDMVFYTLSLNIFQKKFNEALVGLPMLPLEFSAEEDNEWVQYSQMLDIAKTDDEAFAD